MSKEKLQAFAEVVSKNEELQKQLVAIQVEAARSTAEKIATSCALPPFSPSTTDCGELLQSTFDTLSNLLPKLSSLERAYLREWVNKQTS